MKINKLANSLFIISILSIILLVFIYFGKQYIIQFGENLLHQMYYATYADSIFVQNNSFESLLNLLGNAYNILIKSVFCFSVIITIASLLFYFRIKGKISSNLFKILLIIFLFADVAFYGSITHQTSFGSQDDLIQNKEVLEFLKQDTSIYRVLIFDQEKNFMQYSSVKYNIHQFLGIGSSRLIYFDEFLEHGINIIDPAYARIKWGNLVVPPERLNYTYSSKLLGMMNIKYILTEYELNNKDYILKEKLNGIYIYENKKVLHRAFIVHDFQTISDRDLIFNKMKEPSFNPSEMIILEEPLISNTDEYENIDKAEIELYSPNRVTIKTNLNSPGFLVLSDVWYPGWKAFDNGKLIDIYKTNYIIRSVYLEEGKHTIEFKFDPMSFKIGKLVSIITLISLLIYFIIYFKIK